MILEEARLGKTIEASRYEHPLELLASLCT
jgi:hypothetical protein